VLLVGDGIVVEKGFQAHRFHIQDLAEEIESENQLPGDPETLSDLPGVKAGFERSGLFRDIPRGPSEKRVSSSSSTLVVNLGEAGSLTTRKSTPPGSSPRRPSAEGKNRVFGFRQLDLDQGGAIALGTKKARRLFSLLVAKGHGVDSETAVEGGRDEKPVKPFLLPFGTGD